MKTYAEKRFFEWHEDDLSVSLRSVGGSYGGGSEVLVVKSYGLDSYNQQTFKELASTVKTNGGGLLAESNSIRQRNHDQGRRGALHFPSESVTTKERNA